jgi:dTDP-4-dehydrorhamnose reductase
LKKIYVISGATGLLANEIYQYLSKYKKNKVFFSHYKKLKSNNKILTFDYSKPKLVCNILDEIKCDVFIHTAGLTNIDECQKNKEKAKFANIEVTKNLIKACKISKKKIKFIYISTDQLFNGKIKTGYSEVSKVKPLNFYAKTKILSENFIKKNYRNYLILRTNFFGKGNKFKKSFSDKIIQNLKKGQKVDLFSNVIFNPISINILIKIILNLCNLDAKGTYNVSSDDPITKYELGVKIAKLKGYNKSLIVANKLENLNLTKRPNSMYLKNNKLKKIIKYKSSLKENLEFI